MSAHRSRKSHILDSGWDRERASERSLTSREFVPQWSRRVFIFFPFALPFSQFPLFPLRTRTPFLVSFLRQTQSKRRTRVPFLFLRPKLQPNKLKNAVRPGCHPRLRHRRSPRGRRRRPPLGRECRARGPPLRARRVCFGRARDRDRDRVHVSVQSVLDEPVDL